MTWTKLSDEFADDPRLLGVPRGVRLLHVEALIWCNRQSTDGNVPGTALGRLTDQPRPRAAAAQLVTAGLWQATQHGWLILGFLADQPSADDMEHAKGLARERQRRQRQHRMGAHDGCDPRYCREAKSAGQGVTSRRDMSVSHTVSHGTPTRPDPKGRGREAGRPASPASAGAPAGPATSPVGSGRPADPADSIRGFDIEWSEG